MATTSLSLLLLLTLLTTFHGQLLVHSFDSDYSYKESVYEATDLTLEDEYDYIVVGAGLSGCPLAATLSEQYKVLLLDRGSLPFKYPDFAVDSALLTEEDNGDDEDVDNMLGKKESKNSGGTNLINTGIYTRAGEEFIKFFGLVKEQVEKAYKWVEDALVSKPTPGVWQSAVKEALLEAGVSPDNEFSLDHTPGTKVAGSTYDSDGKRHGADELLSKGKLTNLRIGVHANVERITFTNTTRYNRPTATGVIYTDKKGRCRRASLRSGGEVLLSAGASGSPQLLLLSGVGPAAYLKSQNIPVVSAQPYVGKFVADNPRNNIAFLVPFPLEASPAQVLGVTEDYSIESASYKLSLSPVPFPNGLFPNKSSIDASVANIISKIPGPKSYGSLTLGSTSNSKTAPIVRYNYFKEPIDLSRCVSAIKKIEELLNTKSLDRFKYTDLNGEKGFLFLGPYPTNTSDEKSLEDFCKGYYTSSRHSHGGSVVGKVVSYQFRVKGIRSLRVVDSSTFPSTPGSNPDATLMMLGRYVGLNILRDRSQATSTEGLEAY